MSQITVDLEQRKRAEMLNAVRRGSGDGDTSIRIRTRAGGRTKPYRGIARTSQSLPTLLHTSDVSSRLQHIMRPRTR
jgi:hypothetical protein